MYASYHKSTGSEQTAASGRASILAIPGPSNDGPEGRDSQATAGFELQHTW